MDKEVLITLITALIAPVTIAGAAVLWKFLEKKLNLRIKELEKQMDSRDSDNKRNIGTIYNALSVLLANMKASRVYIIQPHPLKHHQYISVAFEVDDIGVMPAKSRIQKYPIDQVPEFVGELSSRDFIFWKDPGQMKGIRAKANFINIGTESLFIKHLADDKNDWVGSLVVDYLQTTTISPDYARSEMASVADKIQFIIPEI